MLLAPAQPIEKGEENHTDPCSDQGIQQKPEREHRHMMVEQHAFGDGEHYLMEMKKDEDEAEAADRMLGIDSRANRGRDIADACLRDAVHANRIVVTQRVLRDADRRAEKHSAHRVAPADAEIDRDKQGQIDKLRKTAIFVKESLKDQRKKTDKRDRAAIVFVYFDIGFRSRAGAQHRGHVNDGERLAPRCLQARDSLRLLPGFLRFSSELAPAGS